MYNLGAGCGGAHSRKSQADLFKYKASQGFKFKATQGDLVSNKTRQRQNKKNTTNNKKFPTHLCAIPKKRGKRVNGTGVLVPCCLQRIIVPKRKENFS